MAEKEIKKVELNDDDLEEVAGGISLGDTLRNNVNSRKENKRVENAAREDIKRSISSKQGIQ